MIDMRTEPLESLKEHVSYLSMCVTQEHDTELEGDLREAESVLALREAAQHVI